jgi:hypothetical protein
MGRLSWSAALVMVSSTCLGAAAAEPGEASTQELFDAGLKDMLAGRYDSGCPAIAESYRREPLAGALFTLAECEAKWGKLARALAHYQEYLVRYERMGPERRKQQGERARVARRQVEVLGEEVPRLTLVPASDAPSDLVVLRDGERVPPVLLGSAMTLDPGIYVIRVESAGRPAHVQRIELAPGERRRVVVGGPVAPRQEKAPAPPRELDNLRIAAICAGVVGAAGVVVGTVAGAVTLEHRSTIEDECVELACSPRGLEAADDSRVSGGVATFGFVVALVGFGTATGLWLAAVESQPARGPGDESARGRLEVGVAPTGMSATYRW